MHFHRRRRSALHIPLALVGALAVWSAPREARANAETEEVWTELGVRIIPLRRLRVTLSNSARFTPIYGLRRVLPEVEVEYRVWGPLRLGAGYRYLWRRNARDEIEQGHMVYGEATAQWRFARKLDLEFRSRVQWRMTEENQRGWLYDDTRDMWRNRLQLEWNLPASLTASAFGEHWTRFDDGFAHNRFRVGGALAIDVSNWRFQLFYQRDMPSDLDTPNVNMVGVNARVTLDLTR